MSRLASDKGKVAGSIPAEGTYGLLEESGRPHLPVKEKITGSNPVQTA